MAQNTNGQKEDQYQIPHHGIGKRQDNFGASLAEAIQPKNIFTGKVDIDSIYMENTFSRMFM